VSKKSNPLIYNPHDPNKDTKGRKYLFDPYARVFNETESPRQSTATGGGSSSRSHGIHHTADQQNSPMLAEKIIRHIANPIKDQSVVDFSPMVIAENRIDPVSKITYQGNEVSHNLAGHVNLGNIGAVHVEPVTQWVGHYPDPNPFGSAIGACISEDVEMTPKVADVVMQSKLHDIKWPKPPKMNYKDPLPPPSVLGNRKRNDIFTPGGVWQKTKVEKKMVQRLMAAASKPAPQPSKPIPQPPKPSKPEPPKPKPTEYKSKPVPPKKPEKPHPYQKAKKAAIYGRAQKLYNLMN
jgi:hypothetical protein